MPQELNQMITLEEIIRSYEDSLGSEPAKKLLLEATHRLGLDQKVEFTKEEAVLICKELQEKSGFIGVVAGILLSRFRKL